MPMPAPNLPLPVIQTLPDCADFSKTVTPYLPQLSTLPRDIAARISNLDDLEALYLSTNPVISALFLAIFVSAAVLLVSEINKNYSQVDRLWGILPAVYVAHYRAWAHAHGLPTQRLDNVLAFSAIWSMRLTFNYWRKGGYQIGSEDYRWDVLRAKISPPLMFVLNVVYTSLAQNILLWAATSPAYVLLLASRFTEQQMTTSDTVFVRVLVALVLLEYFADQQQWDFQEAKRKYQKTARVPQGWKQEDLDRGFLCSGLWAWSRHPNFAAEQAIWFVFYFWCHYETSVYVNWTVAGALSYSLIFQGSTPLTEAISSSKYPEYKEYQQKVGRFLPGKFISFRPKGSGQKQKPKEIKKNR